MAQPTSEAVRPHIPYSTEQQRLCQTMTALGHALFEDGPLVRVVVRGPLGEIEGVGLVDTGCGFSCVHAADAEQLGCQKAQQQFLIGAAPDAAAGTHLVSLYAITMSVNGVCVREARGIDLGLFRRDMLRPDLIAVVGRDVLASCRFNYDGRGVFKLEEQ